MVGCSSPAAVTGDDPDNRVQAPEVLPSDFVPCPHEDEETIAAHRAIARVRALAGLPGLRCDEPSSRAARAHCEYVAANKVLTHVEEPRRPKFTGVHFADRMIAANAPDAPGGEVLANIGGAEAIEGPSGFLNSVYHRAPFLRREMVSFGYGHAEGCSTIDFGKDELASDSWVVWPPNGATAVPTTFVAARELPNPVHPREVVGSPVSLISHFALPGLRATLVGPNGRVAAIVITSADPSGLVHRGEVHVVPERPLDPLTTYTATFTVDAGATRFDVTTTFTTGAR